MWSHFSGQKENLLLDDNITTNLEHWIVRGPRHPHKRPFETLIRQARGGKGGNQRRHDAEKSVLHIFPMFLASNIFMLIENIVLKSTPYNYKKMNLFSRWKVSLINFPAKALLSKQAKRKPTPDSFALRSPPENIFYDSTQGV